MSKKRSKKPCPQPSPLSQVQSIRLITGDNQQVMQEVIPDGAGKLVYIDPLYNSNSDYTTVVPGCTAQELAYSDTWVETRSSMEEWDLQKVPLLGRYDHVVQFIESMQDTSRRVYLKNMAPRLFRAWACLCATGVMVIHCDDTVGHYLKVICDGLFGSRAFLQQVYVQRATGRAGTRRLPRNHDILLIFTRSDDYTFHPQSAPYSQSFINRTFTLDDNNGRGVYCTADLTGARPSGGMSGESWRGFDPQSVGKGRHWALPTWAADNYQTLTGLTLSGDTVNRLDQLYAANMLYQSTSQSAPRIKRYLQFHPEEQLGDYWIFPLASNAKERVNFDTQKPLELLRVLIRMFTDPGDLVIDIYSGSGTTMLAACLEKRRGLGIEISPAAQTLARRRIIDCVGEGAFEKHSDLPTTLDGLMEIAAKNPKGIEEFVCRLLGGSWTGQHGTDGGKDGYFQFGGMPDNASRTGIIQIKTGARISPVKDLSRFEALLKGDSKYTAGVVVLNSRTPALEVWAAGFGQYLDAYGQPYPRMQIITFADLYNPDLKYGGLRVPHHIPVTQPESVRRSLLQQELDCQIIRELDDDDMPSL